MAPSVRSRAFSFVLESSSTPDGSKEDGVAPSTANIIVNSNQSVPIETEFFKGRCILMHETGNEPGCDDDHWGDEREKRGVEFQLQGQFKRDGTKDGDPMCTGLWVAAELEEPMKLGWITQGLVQLIIKFFKKMNGGRAYCHIGDKSERPHGAVPVGNVFNCIVTPPGGEPPKLGSAGLVRPDNQASMIDVYIDHIYTLWYKTPFMDLCSWELLNIPGVSPLAVEKIIGDVKMAKMIFYDAGHAGTHADPRAAAILEFTVTRGQEGEMWVDPERHNRHDDGAKTPLSEGSSGSEEGSHASEDSEVIIEDGGDDDDAASSSSSSSSSTSGPLEDEESISQAESQALTCIDAWRPTALVTVRLDEGNPIAIPYYIEAIDRRRRRRVRIWYVFNVANPPDSIDWWHAKAATELRGFCRPRPRMRAFRRGAARGCHGVGPLEVFRQVVATQTAAPDSRVRRALMVSASHSLIMAAQATVLDSAISEDLLASSRALRVYVPVPGNKKAKGPLLPPPFFGNAGSRACQLAFANAREGRQGMLREGVIGAIHFEGRLCEELLRLSSDGVLRSFTPYDCDKGPRLRVRDVHILTVTALPGLFLGRFARWQVHCDLKVFVFCSAEAQDRDLWIDALTKAIGANKAEKQLTNGSAASPRKRNSAAFPAKAGTSEMLTDITRARRWRPKHRLIMNDRQLLFGDVSLGDFPSSIIEGMLDRVLTFAEQPTPEELSEFIDATCLLKVIRFSGWPQSERLSFWLNVYHCLLLHGRLVLGTPRNRRELARFNSRVSYLVGLTPVSLKEIERYILQIPGSHNTFPHTVRGVKKMKQILTSFLCPCRRRRGVSLPESEGNSRMLRGLSGESDREMKCIPGLDSMVHHLPRPWRKKMGGAACLYLGNKPEVFSVPSQDLRAVFCLNRGNLSCRPEVPIFHMDQLDNQLDDVARAYCVEFVQVNQKDGNATKVSLPHFCRALKEKTNLNSQALLRFVYNFVPPERGSLTRMTRVRINKYRAEPRERSEFKKLSFTLPDLETPVPAMVSLQSVPICLHGRGRSERGSERGISSTGVEFPPPRFRAVSYPGPTAASKECCASPSRRGPEFNVISGAAQALEKHLAAGRDPKDGRENSRNSASPIENDHSPIMSPENQLSPKDGRENDHSPKENHFLSEESQFSPKESDSETELEEPKAGLKQLAPRVSLVSGSSMSSLEFNQMLTDGTGKEKRKGSKTRRKKRVSSGEGDREPHETSTGRNVLPATSSEQTRRYTVDACYVVRL